MKKLFLLLLPFFAYYLAGAQLSTVEKIRAHYAKINAAIEQAIKQKTGMYCNEVTVNKTGTVWPDVGTYQKTTSFWHSDEADHEDADKIDEKTLLQKVLVKEVSADTKSSEEYLFYQGELIFYYYYTAYKSEKGPQRDEHRIYFNHGKLLKHDLSKGSMEIEPETKKSYEDDALTSAKRLLQLFEDTGY